MCPWPRIVEQSCRYSAVIGTAGAIGGVTESDLADDCSAAYYNRLLHNSAKHVDDEAVKKAV